MFLLPGRTTLFDYFKADTMKIEQGITPRLQKRVLDRISSIILFGTESAIALPVVRILGVLLPDHVPIYSLSFDKGSYQLSTFSRYLDRHYYLESTERDKLVQELRHVIDDTGATLMLPVDEPYVRLLSDIRNQLEDHIYIPPLPRPSVFDMLVYKDQLHAVLQKYNFPCAGTYLLNASNLAKFSVNSYPLILKPVHQSSGVGIRRVETRKELAESIKVTEKEDYIAQEYIPGQDMGCSLLAEDGEIKAITIQRGLEQKGFNFPTAIKFENNQPVYQTVSRLIKLTGYSGLANLDFRLDNRDGEPKLIDFNARFWSSILGSRAAGVDFVLLSCFASLGVNFKKPSFYENIYLMGASTFNYYKKNMRTMYAGSDANDISTDLWHRIFDPLPEIVRFANRLQSKKSRCS